MHAERFCARRTPRTPLARISRSAKRSPRSRRTRSRRRPARAPTEISITWSSTPPRRLGGALGAHRAQPRRAPAVLVAAGEPAVQAVQRAEALADDRHPDRQPDQHQQVRAGATAARSPRSARRGRSGPAARRSTSRPSRRPSSGRAARRPVTRASAASRSLHVPGFRCDNRGVYREFAPPPDLAEHVACVWTSVSRGGVIFPDGCVDIVWRGTARRRRAGDRAGALRRACRRAGVRRALPARRGRRGARPARGRVPGRDGADRRRLGPGRRRAGGRRRRCGVLAGRARAPGRRAGRPAGPRGGARDGAPGRARGRARSWA